jgi:hypothetical protein
MKRVGEVQNAEIVKAIEVDTHTHTGRSLGSNKGLVPIVNTKGLSIAYATAPNQTASDISAGSSQYAKTLAEEITKLGQEAVTMFHKLQFKVKQAIGQDPWLSFPTLRSFYFAGERIPRAAATKQK